MNDTRHFALIGLARFALLTALGAWAVACAPPPTIAPATADPLILSATPVGQRPMRAVLGAGAAWVANAGDGTVSRLDPASGQVTATIAVGDPTVFTARDECTGGVHSFHNTSFEVRQCDVPSAVVVAAGSVWAAKNEANALVRIDPARNAVIDTVALGGKPWALAATDDAIWVSDYDDDALIRVDARSGAVAGRIAGLPHGPTEMAIAGDALWVLTSRSASVTRVDPRSGRVVATVSLAARPTGIALVGDEVWARNDEGTMFRVDTRTNAVIGTFAAAGGEGRPGIDLFAPTAAGVWVPGIGLRLVDPATQQVRRQIDLICYAVTAAPDGTLWVLDIMGRVLRLRP